MSEDGDTLRRKQVEELVRRLEPRIIEIFRRFLIEAPTASTMLEEIVTLLLYRWADVTLRDSWFLEMLEHRARRCSEQDALGALADPDDLA